ncbi:MAG: hypothetical protein GOMPHAMPRED_001749 [Gomphillus americanus]|uniref:Uncharacterized protein n=1 Tax=Gomphillus americanus TaxID=1940652 RepID=A0A8H3F4U5_9LECA|nr:MAG: hypothetical protein GOMPHAMPRED_001749 [Gomphillus americanus]
MHFISVFLTLFLAFTGILAAPVDSAPLFAPEEVKNGTIRPKAENVIAQFQFIDTQIANFNQSLNKFHSRHVFQAPFRLFLLTQAVSWVKYAEKRAIRACKQAPNLTRKESDRVVEQLMILEPHIRSVMNNIVAHKHDFDTAILNSGSITHIIAKRLRFASRRSDDIVKALTAKLVPEYAKLAPIATAGMKKDYDRVVELFENSKSEFEMPDVTNIYDMTNERFKQAGRSIGKWFKKIGHHHSHKHDHGSSQGNMTKDSKDLHEGGSSTQLSHRDLGNSTMNSVE